MKKSLKKNLEKNLEKNLKENPNGIPNGIPNEIPNEILEPIYFLSTRAEYYEFSNFYPSPINLNDKIWATVEHYFQALKFQDPDYQELIRQARTPRLAKKLGQTRAILLRDDWETVKDEIMMDAVNAKFSQHEILKKLLLSTGKRPLIEDNRKDNYWGSGPRGTGLNKLGKILERKRDDFNRHG